MRATPCSATYSDNRPAAAVRMGALNGCLLGIGLVPSVA